MERHLCLPTNGPDPTQVMRPSGQRGRATAPPGNAHVCYALEMVLSLPPDRGRPPLKDFSIYRLVLSQIIEETLVVGFQELYSGH